MTLLSASEAFDALEATWPPMSTKLGDGWKMRMGGGGGQRVSASTWERRGFDGNIEALETAQIDEGHPLLVMVRGHQIDLDATLEKEGFHARDETIILAARTSDIGAANDKLDTYPAWPPLAAQAKLWENHDVGENRIAVMERVRTTKTAMLGRRGDDLVANLFCGIIGSIAMVHALVVSAEARREGIGSDMMRAINAWARENGAEWLTVLVVRDNTAAVNLYGKLGLREIGKYHYRFRPENAS